MNKHNHVERRDSCKMIVDIFILELQQEACRTLNVYLCCTTAVSGLQLKPSAAVEVDLKAVG